MIEWIWLLVGGPLLALIIRVFHRVPQRPKLLHTPYARPGPWHLLKLITARVWLAWELVRHPRELNVINTTSKKYENIGLVASEIEKKWEQPQPLQNRESLDGMFFYATDGSGTFLKIYINRMINRQAVVSLLFTLKDGTTYELPNAPDTLVSNTDGKQGFNAGGIKFQLLEAMRRWRIVFNGLAKRTGSDGEVTETHLRLNLTWSALSRPYEFKREFSRKLLAQGMARELWRGRREWHKMCEPTFNGMDQWGAMVGTYQDSGLNAEKELYLRGLRQRRWGQNNPSTLHRKLDIIGMCEDGNFFYLSATSDSQRLTHEVWGHLNHPNGSLYKVNACNLDLERLGENGPVPRHFSLRFSAKRRNYHAIIHLMPNSFESFTGRPWRHRTSIHPCHLTLNSRQGRVLFLSTNAFHGYCPLETDDVSLPYLSAPQRPPSTTEADKLVLMFTDEACRFENLVGGKGSSLALLTSTVKDSPVPCIVPAGFCVTVGAWKAQTRGNEELQKLFKQVQDAIKEDGQLEGSCKKASELVRASPVIPFIQDCIREALRELFGDKVEGTLFAVRSSALGEDGEELSAAGQNATVLGCKGPKAVLEGLQQCWASLLSYQSVEYRRQHGEPLIPGMGVVIQEMVDAESAGVLFTVNPTDGNPSRMILTANYGLGESVVSASVDPDTIYLKRTSSGEVSIAEKTLGTKQSKIILLEDGTREESLPSDQSSAFCLSDATAEQIGQLGVYLEKRFGGPRDLEFAMSKGTLYLLQARPVTALDAWTDHELRHEFDTPILTDSDYLTKANVGEVAPGAMSPLTLSIIGRTLELNYQTVIKKQFGRMFEINPWYMGRFDALHENHLFLNVIDGFLRDIEAEVSDSNRAIDMAVFGHIVTTPAMHRLALQRFGVAGLRVKIRRYQSVFRDLFFNHKRVDRASAKFSGYTFPLDRYTDPAELYGEICNRLPGLVEIGRVHTQVSKASAMTQLIAFIIMLDGRREWTPELYGEMAQLFSSISNIESADVPVALKELAKAIVESPKGGSFVSESPEAAAKWLEEDSGSAGNLYRAFISRHGHRSIKEFDLATETWGLNPVSLLSVLQSMVSNPTSFSGAASASSSGASSKADDSWLKNVPAGKYRALKFFVPRCRNAVIAREKTKSLFIRIIHCFRLAYRRLGQLLAAQGKIPDSGLIFFFIHSELQELVSSKAVALIAKAVRRRKLHPELDSLVFPELSLGIPKPIQDNQADDILSGADGLELRGTPVFKGVVRATARVALNLEEAKQIQCGDILITRSTDIGWSPYFPLLSGVVTELGGLISHGAVVAREYGLPAIVGCQKVTQVFRSGDLVVLDGSKGTITRVEPAN